MNFDKIFNDFYAYLLFVAKKEISLQDAEDAVAHSFIAIWRSKDQLFNSNNAQIKQYLITVLRNKIRDFQKTSKLHLAKDFEYWDNQPMIDESEIQAEVMSRLLLEAVEKLPKAPKKIIQLTLQGYGPREIADRLGKSEHTIWSQKNAAIKYLRKEMMMAQ